MSYRNSVNGPKLANHSKAIFLILSAVFFFTMMDAAAKRLTYEIGILPTIWARYVGQAIIVFAILAPRLSTIAKTNYPRSQLARSVLLMCATSCFFLSISKIGLAEATAIMNVNPVLITLGAFLFLGERIGLRRIIGILFSLFGAMIIIGPGTSTFTIFAIMPLLSAICFAAYSITTRFIGKNEDPATSLLYTAICGAVVFSLLVPNYWQQISIFSAVLICILATAGTLGHFFLIKAFSLGEASMLAPFIYAGLVYSTIWGILFFDEYPDLWTVFGALLIAVSGIYVWYRETLTK
jgi:drug/metabolite transporter (DMT)-like permease